MNHPAAALCSNHIDFLLEGSYSNVIMGDWLIKSGQIAIMSHKLYVHPIPKLGNGST